MNPRILAATTGRVLLQLRHDKRTVALLIVAPTGIMALLAWMFSSEPQIFDHWGPLLLGIFLHGASFVPVFITAQIYLNQRIDSAWRTRAPDHLRARVAV